MITFFRRLRHSILSEGKTVRYLKYALGEIVLVVIGILIALQINNWNERRIQHEKEKEIITSVKNDLKQDRAFIQFTIEVIEPKIEAYSTLNRDLFDLYQNDRKSLDSIFKIYFSTNRTFYPILGSYQSAVSGNQLTNFRNKKLSQQLIKLYNSTYDRLIDNGQILDERWAFISKKYSHERRTGSFRDMEPEQLSEFLDDLYHHYVQLEWYINQLKLAAVKIDKIIIENKVSIY
ncbi:hypothetical protein G3567_10845 [Psychroflexus sp. YR1-1]|uniref:Uncharacterized protein n=1 Tax=Psychroflexus aurantiacus TaxID=2709310 RepID=A0A6B3RAM9_9FLAO|nr:DUF6090 family protein [Psychroflexus aurantiacus]NEV94641.1 hypothetical protein [Psychroflexus aurantiacus]